MNDVRDPSMPDPDMAAAELALGLLEGEERAAALRRMLADRAFAREVDAWQERLVPLGDAVPAVAPSAVLWPRIEAALSRDDDGKVRLLRRVRRWRAVAAAATAIAASLALVLVLRPTPVAGPTTRPSLMAQVAPSDASAVLLASYDPAKAELTVSPATLAAGNHSAQLWLIPAGDKPHSLGLIGAGARRIVIPVALRPALDHGATIAVSLEPRGGSPTGQPTGPVVATGKFTII